MIVKAIRMDQELVESINKLASIENRTFSNMVRELLINGIKEKYKND